MCKSQRTSTTAAVYSCYSGSENKAAELITWKKKSLIRSLDGSSICVIHKILSTRGAEYWLLPPKWSLMFKGMVFSPDDSSQELRHWTGMSASSWSFSPHQFCHSCAKHEPSSDTSSFYDFPSGFPSDVRVPLCVWKKTGMSLFLYQPTRYCPSCRHSLKGPAGTGTDESSSYCLWRQERVAQLV